MGSVQITGKLATTLELAVKNQNENVGEWSHDKKNKYKYNLYLPSAVFIVQVLVGPSKQLKKIIQTEHNIAKIPTGRRQTSWLFTSVVEDLNSRLPRNKSRWWLERDSNPGPLDSESDTLTTQPRQLLLDHQIFTKMPFLTVKSFFFGCHDTR